MSLTRVLGEFAADLRFDDVPQDAAAVAARAFADCAAAIVAGSDEPVTQLVLAQSDYDARNRESRLALSDRWVSARVAALVNGTAAHALEFDDVGLMGHPSAVLVPAIMAEGEARQASGREVLTAYVAGFETWARLLERDRDGYHTKGWHTTSMLGTVAAAAAVANLRGLDPDRSANALGLAAAMTSGIRASFGTMAKPLQAGLAASSAVQAARWSDAGISASSEALEHTAGLLHAMSPRGRVDLASPVDDLGRNWRIVDQGVHLRKYPMCYGGERAIEAALEIVTRDAPEPAQVRAIEVLTGENQSAMMRCHLPAMALEARFSFEFAMACAIAARRVSLGETTDAYVAREDVRSLMSRVRVRTHPGVDSGDARFADYDQVSIELHDGRLLTSRRISQARGHHGNPLGAQEVREKLLQCMTKAGRGGDTDKLAACLQDLASVANIRSLGT